MSEKSKAAGSEKKPRHARPFLKWAGGKRQLLPDLMKRLPDSFRNYHEPFLGGGALFFELAARGLLKKKAYLSDLNEELIETYIVVQTGVEDLIRSLKKHVHNEEYFYRIRDLNPADLDVVERASRLIYLNKTCFNGLYRVNSKGEFNVPFGNYKNPTICDEENLRLCSAALRDVSIRRQSYFKVMSSALRGDFIYFDPPYHPVSKTASFASYQKDGFGEEDQRRLRDIFEALDRKRCFAMLSNSHSAFTKGLYKDYKPEIVEASRAVNSKGSARGPVKEIIVRNYTRDSVRK